MTQISEEKTGLSPRKLKKDKDMYEALKLTRNNLQTLSDAALHYKRTFSSNLDILNKVLAKAEEK